MGCQSTGPLTVLWEQRHRENDDFDYPIGPGDILDISAVDLPELNNVKGRVDGQGAIDLPLLGDMHVAGLTEDQVESKITDSAREYQRDPRVHVFIQHYAGRNVQVMGMVAQPGTYSLDSPSETLLSVLGRAGGLKGVGSDRPADRIVLFPAVSKSAAASACHAGQDHVTTEDGTTYGSTCDSSSSPGTVMPVSTGNRAPVGPGASVTPIEIDLAKPAMAGCLALPARPGDIVLVPAAGQVGVYGWVARPGSFDVTSGMTVLGAISAAGGSMFSSNAELLRTVGGERDSTPINLSEAESGRQPDLPVQAGDVILVKSSVVGAVPYAVYTLFSKFGTGLYLAPTGF
jgi:protein involved in polysaccharide export with SLBB domain